MARAGARGSGSGRIDARYRGGVHAGPRSGSFGLFGLFGSFGFHLADRVHEVIMHLLPSRPERRALAVHRRLPHRRHPVTRGAGQPPAVRKHTHCFHIALVELELCRVTLPRLAFLSHA
eukprot:SAG31_NODE_5956_length_2242_cov_1.588894_4_plen_118_part_01